MLRAAVPKTAIDKYGDLGRWEDQIRTASDIRDWPSVFEESKASAMEDRSQPHLRASVLPAIPLHNPANRLRRSRGGLGQRGQRGRHR